MLSSRDISKLLLKDISKLPREKIDMAAKLIVSKYPSKATQIYRLLKRQIQHQDEYIEITTAVAIEKENKAYLENILNDKTGKNNIYTYIVDPKIIGGIKIRVGETIIDDSQFGKIQALKENLNRISLDIKEAHVKQ